jgi:tetratricopeptide (TPR) repeat protein
MQKGAMDEAESVCRRLLKRLPDLARVPDADLPKDPTDMRVASHHDWLLYVQANNNLGLASMHAGRMDDARSRYREALRVYPRYTLVRNNLAYVLFRQGETNGAVAEWRTVLETAPADPEAHYMLGGVAESRGGYAEAVQHYLKALAQRPAFHTRVAGDLAWLLATCPDAAVRDGRSAVALAEEVVRATGTESPRAYDVLGAALAEAGRHPEAAESARRAVQLLEAASSAGTAGAEATSTGLWRSAIQARLRQYERGESFHVAAPAGMTAP